MKKRLPRLADDILPKLEVPVVRLVEADRPALLDYYRRLSLADRLALFGFPLPDDKLSLYVHRLNLESDGHVAARGAASLLIGVGHCVVFDNQGVLNLHVAHGYRRRGIGTAMGRELARFGAGRSLRWLRAYFSKNDPIAASLARRLGLELNFGLDRFYAERALVKPDSPAQRPMGPRPAPDRMPSAHARAKPAQAAATA